MKDRQQLSKEVTLAESIKNSYQHDLLRFFDYFLKGRENGWRATLQVRMTVVDFAGHDILDRAEQ